MAILNDVKTTEGIILTLAPLIGDSIFELSRVFISFNSDEHNTADMDWDASGFIVLSQYDPTGLGSKIRSINTSTGIVGPVLRELEEENIGDLAEWISQKPTRTL